MRERERARETANELGMSHTAATNYFMMGMNSLIKTKSFKKFPI